MNGQNFTQPLKVEADPRWESSKEGFEEQLKVQLELRDMVTEIHKTIAEIRSVRGQIESYMDRLNEDQAMSAKSIMEQLTNIEETLIQTKTESHQDPINYPVKLDTQVGYLYSVTHSQEGKPNDAIYERMKDLEAEWAAVKNDYKKIIDNDLESLVKAMQESDMPHIVIPEN